jgi:hypothetical protein
VQFTQIQNEIIDTAHSQGQVDPATFARLMLYEPDDVQPRSVSWLTEGWWLLPRAAIST